MAKNEEIKILYNKKIKSLKKHNKLYFTNDNPQISDADYDKLKIELLELEKKYPFCFNASVIFFLSCKNKISL